MTGSRTVGRVIFLDGFAGHGRYEDGRPGSAERIMKMAQVQHQHVGLAWSRWFVEKDTASAAALGAVVSEFLLNFSMDAVRRIGGQAAGHNPDPPRLHEWKRRWTAHEGDATSRAGIATRLC